MPCGSTKRYDDCARCCDRSRNVKSSCVRRRRRRLADAVDSIADADAVDEAGMVDEALTLLQTEMSPTARTVGDPAEYPIGRWTSACAEACLKAQGCVAYRMPDINDPKEPRGTCELSFSCDSTKADDNAYRKDKWFIQKKRVDGYRQTREPKKPKPVHKKRKRAKAPVVVDDSEAGR
jgi:hypothetical protein